MDIVVQEKDQDSLLRVPLRIWVLPNIEQIPCLNGDDDSFKAQTTCNHDSPIGGSIKYRVLTRTKGRCECCGAGCCLANPAPTGPRGGPPRAQKPGRLGLPQQPACGELAESHASEASKAAPRLPFKEGLGVAAAKQPDQIVDLPPLDVGTPQPGCPHAHRRIFLASLRSRSSCCWRSGDAVNPNRV